MSEGSCWCGESGCGCKRYTSENARLRAERDDWKDCADTTKTFCDIKLAEVADFLDALASRLDAWTRDKHVLPTYQAAADCRALAERLRSGGEQL